MNAAKQKDESDGFAAAGLFRRPDLGDDWSGLSHIGEKLARFVRDILRDGGAEGAAVAYEGHELMAFGAWASERSGFEAMARFRLAPLKGSVGLALPGASISQLVDLHYGGDGGVTAGKSGFSTAELRHFERLGGLFATAIRTWWQDVATVEPEYVSAESAPSRLRVARSDQQVLAQNWTISGGNLTPARLTMVFSIEAIKKLAPHLSGNYASDDEMVNEEWRGALRNAAMGVRLPVRTIFARPELSLEKLMTLKPGDVIPVCLPRKVPVSVSGMLFAYGSIGESDGRAAIRIETVEQGYAEHE